LAIIGLLVGVLVVYYGFLLPDPATTTGAVPQDPTAAEATGDDGANPDPAAAEEGNFAEGLLSSALGRGGNNANNEVLARDATAPPVLQPVPSTANPTTSGALDEVIMQPGPVANQAASLEIVDPTAPPQGTASSTYVIQPNDTLSHIALAWFGDATMWQLIVDANPGVNPDRLRVGQVLTLPATGGTDAAGTGGGATTPSGGGGGENNSTSLIHTVQAGESLSVISERYYGSDMYWKRIHFANQATLGDDPDSLRIGMKIIVPPSPNATESPRM
jgi:nucleoid-associated protein YgaU